ncbi:unnamed protein product [Gongylonema pulchrum]|uniref:Class I SAM-dependent methyltransferase n=1 Tax=Gongylonema pulchrum TaxID=637853 RepID=A0A183DWN3_9BILA|nr:unnamed protein product [Gongylonema pulchrum]
MFDYLIGILSRLYYFMFDRLILYPLLRLAAAKFNIRFMNLGYHCSAVETFFPFFELFTKDDDCKANIALYEKTLSLCPKYPSFEGLKLLEVGCGQCGGIDWILR